MPKPYTARYSRLFNGMYSCAFTMRTGSWGRQSVYNPTAKFGDEPLYETVENTKARLQVYLDEILTKSETIPVVFITRSDVEGIMEDMIKEYPEYITLACDTKTQHPGEHHRVRMWVAHIHDRPAGTSDTADPNMVAITQIVDDFGDFDEFMEAEDEEEEEEEE